MVRDNPLSPAFSGRSRYRPGSLAVVSEGLYQLFEPGARRRRNVGQQTDVLRPGHLRESAQRRLPVENQETGTRHQQKGRKEREDGELHNMPFRHEYEQSFE